MILAIRIEKECCVHVRHEIPDKSSYSGRRMIFDGFLGDPTRFSLKHIGGGLSEPEALIEVWPKERLIAFNVIQLDIQRIGKGQVPIEDMRTGAILLDQGETVVISGSAGRNGSNRAEELTIHAGYRRRYGFWNRSLAFSFWPCGSY